MRIELGKHYLYRLRSTKPVYNFYRIGTGNDYSGMAVHGYKHSHLWLYGYSNGNVATAPTLVGLVKELWATRKYNGR